MVLAGRTDGYVSGLMSSSDDRLPPERVELDDVDEALDTDDVAARSRPSGDPDAESTEPDLGHDRSANAGSQPSATSPGDTGGATADPAADHTGDAADR